MVVDRRVVKQTEWVRAFSLTVRSLGLCIVAVWAIGEQVSILSWVGLGMMMLWSSGMIVDFAYWCLLQEVQKVKR